MAHNYRTGSTTPKKKSPSRKSLFGALGTSQEDFAKAWRASGARMSFDRPFRPRFTRPFRFQSGGYRRRRRR